MKILVTGGTGFIGHHLANELQKRGNDVVVIDRALNNWKFLNPKIELILGDICTMDLSGKYDCVYHLAALRSVPESFFYPEEYINVNLWGTSRLVKAFPETRFVFISSSAARERMSPYGITKRAAECMVCFHRNAISIRLMNVFGERQTDVQMAFPAFCHALKTGGQAIIYGDGTITRDFTYVGDVVREIISLGESKSNIVIDTGYGMPMTIMELYKALAKEFKKKEEVCFASDRRGDMIETCAKNIMSKPKYGFKKGLKRTVEWYKKNG